jgi:hypothetical protein
MKWSIREQGGGVSNTLIGVESKRYEPFRTRHPKEWSQAYWSDCWGERMDGYKAVRDLMRDEPMHFAHLDVPQLVRHAFGLRTKASKDRNEAVLLYVHAEPERWPSGALVDSIAGAKHRSEIAEFAAMVSGAEVKFLSLTYGELVKDWLKSDQRLLTEHAAALAYQFSLRPIA